MALFIVTHRHPPERCPAVDKAKGPMLLRRLSKDGAKTYGVTVLAEAMADGQHTLNMILEAGDRGAIEVFMAPFAQGGSVSIQPASHCDDVAARGIC